MTIQEAFKSGRPIARKNSARHRGSHGTGFVDPEFLLTVLHITKEDIIADDWEIQEEKIQFTGSQLGGLFKRALLSKIKHEDEAEVIKNAILKELGFKDEKETN